MSSICHFPPFSWTGGLGDMHDGSDGRFDSVRGAISGSWVLAPSNVPTCRARALAMYGYMAVCNGVVHVGYCTYCTVVGQTPPPLPAMV